ncbi:hypothetical protein [uncultured Gemella sp.]|nr:hypothetical protein [uncultured Gemella sp.]
MLKKHGYNLGFIRDRNDELYLNKIEYVDDMKNENWMLIERVF